MFDKNKDIVLPAHPTGFILDKGPLAGKTIRYAGTMIIHEYQAEMEPFEEAMDEVAGISGMMMTDESSMDDFCLDQQQLTDLSKTLNIPISENDYVWEVLKKIRNR